MIPIARPIITETEKRYVMEVLESGELASGKKVKLFEERFSRYIGTQFGVATSSGTTALHIALQAAGVRFQDKVITSPFSFIATANSILFCGAQPLFCDIDEQTFNVDPQSIRRILEKERNVKALLIVHLFGLSCDMDEINKIVKEYDLILIEDCAQAHGASYRGKRAGSFGKAAIFSFYPTKNITTSEGGMVMTNDEEVCRQLLLLRNHGISADYEHSVLGYNFRMTNIAAAIGLGQMEKIDEFIEKRRVNANYLDEHLGALPGIKIPHVPLKDYHHVYNQYTIRILREREGFLKHLREREIGHKVFYPTIIPDQIFYRKLGISQGDFPHARKITGEVVSLPVHPSLNEEDLKRIVETVGEYCNVSSGMTSVEEPL